MKHIKLAAIFTIAILSLFSSCKEKTPEPEIDYAEVILGEWNLKMITPSVSGVTQGMQDAIVTALGTYLNMNMNLNFNKLNCVITVENQEPVTSKYDITKNTFTLSGFEFESSLTAKDFIFKSKYYSFDEISGLLVAFGGDAIPQEVLDAIGNLLKGAKIALSFKFIR